MFKLHKKQKCSQLVKLPIQLGIEEDELDLYGKYKAKVSLDVLITS